MMMRKFQSEDREVIREWLISRKMNGSLADDIPENGLIAFESESPIAAGFLRKIEASEQIMLDGLISNPKRQGRLSSRALDMIVDGLIEMGRALGFKQLIANTVNSNVLKRSEWHGFQQMPHALIVKGL